MASAYSHLSNLGLEEEASLRAAAPVTVSKGTDATAATAAPAAPAASDASSGGDDLIFWLSPQEAPVSREAVSEGSGADFTREFVPLGSGEALAGAPPSRAVPAPPTGEDADALGAATRYFGGGSSGSGGGGPRGRAPRLLPVVYDAEAAKRLRCITCGKDGHLSMTCTTAGNHRRWFCHTCGCDASHTTDRCPVGSLCTDCDRAHNPPSRCPHKESARAAAGTRTGEVLAAVASTRSAAQGPGGVSSASSSGAAEEGKPIVPADFAGYVGLPPGYGHRAVMQMGPYLASTIKWGVTYNLRGVREAVASGRHPNPLSTQGTDGTPLGKGDARAYKRLAERLPTAVELTKHFCMLCGSDKHREPSHCPLRPADVSEAGRLTCCVCFEAGHAYCDPGAALMAGAASSSSSSSGFSVTPLAPLPSLPRTRGSLLDWGGNGCYTSPQADPSIPSTLGPLVSLPVTKSLVSTLPLHLPGGLANLTALCPTLSSLFRPSHKPLSSCSNCGRVDKGGKAPHDATACCNAPRITTDDDGSFREYPLVAPPKAGEALHTPTRKLVEAGAPAMALGPAPAAAQPLTGAESLTGKRRRSDSGDDDASSKKARPRYPASLVVDGDLFATLPSLKGQFGVLPSAAPAPAPAPGAATLGPGKLITVASVPAALPQTDFMATFKGGKGAAAGGGGAATMAAAFAKGGVAPSTALALQPKGKSGKTAAAAAAPVKKAAAVLDLSDDDDDEEEDDSDDVSLSDEEDNALRDDYSDDDEEEEEEEGGIYDEEDGASSSSGESDDERLENAAMTAGGPAPPQTKKAKLKAKRKAAKKRKKVQRALMRAQEAAAARGRGGRRGPAGRRNGPPGKA